MLGEKVCDRKLETIFDFPLPAIPGAIEMSGVIKIEIGREDNPTLGEVGYVGSILRLLNSLRGELDRCFGARI